MGHYNLWLAAPAILGIPLQIYIVAVNNFSSPVQIAFAVFIVIWAVIMLEFWKRKEKMTAIEWGLTGFEDEEVDRPGKLSLSIVLAWCGNRISREDTELTHQWKASDLFPTKATHAFNSTELRSHRSFNCCCNWGGLDFTPYPLTSVRWQASISSSVPLLSPWVRMRRLWRPFLTRSKSVSSISSTVMLQTNWPRGRIIEPTPNMKTAWSPNCSYFKYDRDLNPPFTLFSRIAVCQLLRFFLLHCFHRPIHSSLRWC